MTDPRRRDAGSAHCGLLHGRRSPRLRPARDNPFRVSRVEALRYRLSSDGWDRLLDAWESYGHRGALVGPHGSGKTTLLEEVTAHHAADGRRTRHLRFSTEKRSLSAEDHRSLEGLTSPDLVTVDGVEQLAPWTWWRLRRALRPAGAVLVTSHRPGFLPTIHQHRTGPELLADLVEELAPEIAQTLASELPRIHARHDGDLRQCFFELYDRWAAGELNSSAPRLS